MLFFVSLVTLIFAFVTMAKRTGTASCANALGGLWCESVLAEYDLPLQQQYHIFGFYGSSRETRARLDFYANESFQEKNYIEYGGSKVFLDPYSLGSEERMKKQMVHVGKLVAGKRLITAGADLASKGGKGGGAGSSSDSAVPRLPSGDSGSSKGSTGSGGSGGSGDPDVSDVSDSISSGGDNYVAPHPSAERTGRIANQAVLGTLPSSGVSDGFSADRLKRTVKGMQSLGDVIEKGTDKFFLDQYLFAHFRDHVDDRGRDCCYFDNEVEYVICGHPDDKQNLRGVKLRILAVREAMNLWYIMQDPKMVEETTLLAEILTPGPPAAATAKLLQAAWALAESHNDVQLLLNGKKVAFRKDAATWAVDLDSILSAKQKKQAQETSDSKGKGKETKNDHDDHSDTELSFREKVPYIDTGSDRGEDYQDYLRFFVAMTDEELRVLRMMDLIQLNLQYGWYGDFQLRDHYCGIQATLTVNSNDITIRREYYPQKEGK